MKHRQDSIHRHTFCPKNYVRRREFNYICDHNDRVANRYAINGSGFSTCIDMTNEKAYGSQPKRCSHNMLGIP